MYRYISGTKCQVNEMECAIKDWKETSVWYRTSVPPPAHMDSSKLRTGRHHPRSRERFRYCTCGKVAEILVWKTSVVGDVSLKWNLFFCPMKQPVYNKWYSVPEMGVIWWCVFMTYYVLAHLTNHPNGERLVVGMVVEKATFYWPRCEKYVAMLCATCFSCYSRKGPMTKQKARLGYVVKAPLETIAIYIMGPLLRTWWGKKVSFRTSMKAPLKLMSTRATWERYLQKKRHQHPLGIYHITP